MRLKHLNTPIYIILLDFSHFMSIVKLYLRCSFYKFRPQVSYQNIIPFSITAKIYSGFQRNPVGHSSPVVSSV